MDAQGRRISTVRILGNIALVVGLSVTVIGLTSDSVVPAEGYFFAGLLVLMGIGLRLEAAITESR